MGGLRGGARPGKSARAAILCPDWFVITGSTECRVLCEPSRLEPVNPDITRGLRTGRGS